MNAELSGKEMDGKLTSLTSFWVLRGSKEADGTQVL